MVILKGFKSVDGVSNITKVDKEILPESLKELENKLLDLLHMVFKYFYKLF